MNNSIASHASRSGLLGNVEGERIANALALIDIDGFAAPPVPEWLEAWAALAGQAYAPNTL